jgi:endoglucanase
MISPRLARVPHRLDRLARLQPACPRHLLPTPRALLRPVVLATLLAGLSLPSLNPGTLLAAPAAATVSGYLHTDGARLEDASGHEVRLTGINWFGLETCAFAPHGLWSRNWRSMMVQIRKLGFNTIRLPFSSQLLDPGTHPNAIDYRLNPDLKGLSGLQIMDKIVAEARTLGLKVILDRHRPDCGAQSPLWYTDHYSEARWIADWVRLARRYAGNDAVIGADLHNEPHGPATWGDGNRATDWRLAAERAGNAILRVNPHWLIFVEGVEHVGNDWYWWGGNLAAAGRYPVRLIVPHRLVYEVHDYGPGVWQQSWFGAANFPQNLPHLWDTHWGHLQDQGIAPVLVGEFGGKAVDSGKEGAWMRTLMGYIRAHGLSYTFWCLNPNSGDTGGLLEDDWTTVNRAKMALLRTYLAPMIGSGQTLPPTLRVPSHVARPRHPAAQGRSSTPAAKTARPAQAVGTRQGDGRRTNGHAAQHTSTTAPATSTHRAVQQGVRAGVHARVTDGISTGQEDLTLVAPATLYHLTITISVRRSPPGVDPGEANPQALVQGAFSGHITTSTGQAGGTLTYTFTGPQVPAGSATAAARFDFTRPNQNRHGAHLYGKDTYVVTYATAPGGPLTTMRGSF